jgi:carbamoyltransferase
MRILGISAFYHDSAAALVIDGDIVAAAQEERFTRKKHDPGFPEHAIAYCLREAGLDPDQLDFIAFYDKPILKFERLLETHLAFAPSGIRSFMMAMPVWLREKLMMRRMIRGGLPSETKPPLLFMDHHESHAASAFFPSPFDEAAILTLDGVGEWTTTAWGVGRGNTIELRQHLRFPHSLGLLYSAFTYYCGFKVNSGEYKLMGLAPYGKPVYAETIYKKLIDLKLDGSFWLNMDYFNYCQGLTMTNRRFDDLFGGSPRNPEASIEQRHMDLAASIQAVTEEIVLRMGRDIYEKTRMRKLVLAGGVALNCVANGRLLREGPYDDIWIQPAAGDPEARLARRCSRGISYSTSREMPTDTIPRKAAFSAPRSISTTFRTSLTPTGLPTRVSMMARCAPHMSPSFWRKEKSWGGFRAGWSSALGRCAPGPSSATPGRRKCKRQ